ncbi:uncharacterized protein LOC119677989 [Teleopsis dalmanni]|uniref:uncharacterized protein LOC119677989 n=1 Tax=Teleopsis dalmanni TaxID=139649 RepID=UPI0018CF1AA5|nr:uncharacterized protein LOC119677989 [Teleopsis dalmanni]
MAELWNVTQLRRNNDFRCKRTNKKEEEGLKHKNFAVLNTVSTLPTITTTQLLHTQSHDSQTKRPILQRQDYSCLDSSEAQSDDSHLTRDSITRESQNDELSSSTHDKIDVSTLPLPALPPKKRRSRLRASPSKYHSRRHEFDAQSDQQTNLAANVSSNETIPHLSAFQQYVAKRRESLEASTRSFNEKLEARRMHYHMGGGGGGGTAGTNAGNASGMHMPTYLFGEHYYGGLSTGSRKTVAPTSKEEIFLNKSGWVQVNTKRGNDENRGYRRANYAHQNGDMQRNTIRVIQIDNTRRSDMARQALLQHQHSLADPSVYMGNKYMGSKVEELIQRNEARLSNASRDPTLRPGYRIVDPQLASLLNERPGFLPVRNLNDAESPPPITPILSPPPAFQDSSKTKHFDRRKTVSTRQPQLKPQQQQSLPNTSLHVGMNNGGKGMVFSRSFEYDTRRPTPTDTYVETFSRSFDGNLSERPIQQRDRSPNFSTLTGNSPNYLTKKDSGGGSSGSLRSRDSSPKYQQPQTTAYLNASIKEAPPAYSVASTSVKYSPRTRHERSFERSKSQNILGRSRKSQFNRVGSSGAVIVGNQGPPPSMGMSRFRSFDTTISQRLNSCDSGARSDLSNDELDNEENEGSSEFLTTNYYQATSPFKTQRQRSLTPDRNESHSSSSSLRKQRSLTPESRSLTPEDRRKKGSQVSLMGSRQNSSSRSNTLERKPPRLEDKTVNISRSSSSSSYSGREAHENVTHPTHLTGGLVGSTGSQHRRSLGRNAKQTEEHRIRRSRSLQLSERSPNRSHKMIVCVGQSLTAPNPAAVYQQANLRANINSSGGGHSNFPPTIRTTVKSQPILVNNSNSSGSRLRSNEVDKSRSFDFDYCNYNTATPKSHPSTGNISNNQNVPMRLDFDKSRSFDDDYREPINSNNNLSAGSMRYLKATDGTAGSNSTGRLRRSSPVGSGGSGSIERTTRSPQSSGSSCNNLNLPRQSTSPQNYGTRLCDHELTYDMLRKSLDRSPIMDFRRGDSGDYDLPQPVIRNRETINSGGNSELNFMSNDTRIYEHPTTTAQITQSRSLSHNQSPSESQYSLERLQSSRDSIPADTMNDYRPDYVYRQPQKQHRESRSNNRGRY